MNSFVQTNLPKESQLLLRVLNSDVEIISGDAQSKLINDCKLSDGSLIYVEQVKVSLVFSLASHYFTLSEN